MTELRATVVWLSTLRCPWTAEEAQHLAEVPMRGVRAYLSSLVHQQILTLTGAHYTAGPQAKAWRLLKPKNKGPSTYGNSAKYRAQRALRDALRQRDWAESRKPAAKQIPAPLTSQQASIAITESQEASGMLNSATEPDLTAHEAAAKLGASLATVRREIQRGRIQAHRVGERGVRITAAELDRYRLSRLIGATRG